MATATTLIPIEEYLRTSYHPDCDYVDGEIQERNLGEREHARLQAVLTSLVLQQRESLECRFPGRTANPRSAPPRAHRRCLPHQSRRTQGASHRDPAAALRRDSFSGRSAARAARVMEDYARMGVPNLWLLDPQDRVAYSYTSEGLFKLTTDRLAIPNTEIHVDLPTPLRQP